MCRRTNMQILKEIGRKGFVLVAIAFVFSANHRPLIASDDLTMTKQLLIWRGGPVRTAKHRAFIASVRTDVSSEIIFLAKLQRRNKLSIRTSWLLLSTLIARGRPDGPSSESNHL